MSGNDFWTSGTGTGMANSIPKFRERECKWKIPLPILGTGMRVANSIPIFGNGNASGKFHSRLSGRELEAGIPGNSRDREFPLMVERRCGPDFCHREEEEDELRILEIGLERSI